MKSRSKIIKISSLKLPDLNFFRYLTFYYQTEVKLPTTEPAAYALTGRDNLLPVVERSSVPSRPSSKMIQKLFTLRLFFLIVI